MLVSRRRVLSAAFDLFGRSRDVVGGVVPDIDASPLKRPPSTRVKKLVSEILDLSLIEAADLCDLCQEELSARSRHSSNAFPSQMFAAQMMMPQMMMGHAPPVAAASPAATPAAAPVAEAAPAAPEAAKVVEKTKPAIVSLKLISFDASKKVATVKEVRAITNLGLKEAKDAVEAAPKILKKGVAYEEALAMKQKLEEIGATVELE